MYAQLYCERHFGASIYFIYQQDNDPNIRLVSLKRGCTKTAFSCWNGLFKVQTSIPSNMCSISSIQKSAIGDSRLHWSKLGVKWTFKKFLNWSNRCHDV